MSIVSRSSVIKSASKTSASVAASVSATQSASKYTLPEISYIQDGLKPALSPNVLDYHYNKHHQTYVNNANNLLEGSDLEGKPVEEVMLIAAEDTAKAGLFNQTAQIVNHTFYWHCMSENTDVDNNTPQDEELLKAINESFGDFDSFKDEFTANATALFGSGWTWLVKNEQGKLELANTFNAGNPQVNNQTPLLTVDVWEHAYYLDYQNRRPEYLANWWKVVDWNFVANNLKNSN